MQGSYLSPHPPPPHLPPTPPPGDPDWPRRTISRCAVWEPVCHDIYPHMAVASKRPLLILLPLSSHIFITLSRWEIQGLKEPHSSPMGGGGVVEKLGGILRLWMGFSQNLLPPPLSTQRGADPGILRGLSMFRTGFKIYPLFGRLIVATLKKQISSWKNCVLGPVPPPGAPPSREFRYCLSRPRQNLVCCFMIVTYMFLFIMVFIFKTIKLCFLLGRFCWCMKGNKQ